MRIGEPEALPRQPIYVRRPDPRRPVTPDVAVPQVVGIDKDDIRRVGGRLRTKAYHRQEGEHGCQAGGSESHSDLKDRGYANLVAERLLDYLMSVQDYRGIGCICVP